MNMARKLPPYWGAWPKLVDDIHSEMDAGKKPAITDEIVKEWWADRPKAKHTTVFIKAQAPWPTRAQVKARAQRTLADVSRRATELARAGKLTAEEGAKLDFAIAAHGRRIDAL